MTHDEMLKYSAELVVKNNPDETVKLLVRLQEENELLNNRINKAIEYMRSQYTITDDDLYLALYSSDGTLDKLENILRGEDNVSHKDSELN